MIRPDTVGELVLTEYRRDTGSVSLTLALSSDTLGKGGGKFISSKSVKVLRLCGIEIVYSSPSPVLAVLGAQCVGLWCHGITPRELSETLTWVTASLKQ